jgi:hypothetical protein
LIISPKPRTIITIILIHKKPPSPISYELKPKRTPKTKIKTYTFLGDLMKKCFQMIGIITLLIGSFIYTEKVGTAAKLTDPLLNEIKSKKRWLQGKFN